MRKLSASFHLDGCNNCVYINYYFNEYRVTSSHLYGIIRYRVVTYKNWEKNFSNNFIGRTHFILSVQFKKTDYKDYHY